MESTTYPVHRKVALKHASVGSELFDHVEVPRCKTLRHLDRGRRLRAARPVGARHRHSKPADLDHYVWTLGELGDVNLPLGKDLVTRLYRLTRDAHAAAVGNNGASAVVEADPNLREVLCQSNEARKPIVVKPEQSVGGEAGT